MNLLLTANEGQKYGLDLTTISELLKKWGPIVLQLVIDLLKEGFTKDWIIEALEKLGEGFLQRVLSDCRNRNVEASLKSYKRCCDEEVCPGHDKAYAAPAKIITGEEVDSLDAGSPIVDLIIKLLPKLLENPAIVEAIVKALIALFTKK